MTRRPTRSIPTEPTPLPPPDRVTVPGFDYDVNIQYRRKVLLELTFDQEFLRDTTAKFLASLAPAEILRSLRNDPDGFDREYWRRGADLGWISLLGGDAHGGGSVSG